MAGIGSGARGAPLVVLRAEPKDPPHPRPGRAVKIQEAALGLAHEDHRGRRIGDDGADLGWREAPAEPGHDRTDLGAPEYDLEELGNILAQHRDAIARANALTQ